MPVAKNVRWTFLQNVSQIAFANYVVGIIAAWSWSWKCFSIKQHFLDWDCCVRIVEKNLVRRHFWFCDYFRLHDVVLRIILSGRRSRLLLCLFESFTLQELWFVAITRLQHRLVHSRTHFIENLASIFKSFRCVMIFDSFGITLNCETLIRTKFTHLLFSNLFKMVFKTIDVRRKFPRRRLFNQRAFEIWWLLRRHCKRCEAGGFWAERSNNLFWFSS